MPYQTANDAANSSQTSGRLRIGIDADAIDTVGAGDARAVRVRQLIKQCWGVSS